MDIETVFEVLKNEYNSGIFTLEDGMINWHYKSQGVNNYEEAEDRWLSFLGAKLTAQTIIEGTDFKIIQKFEINNKIGFYIIRETKEVLTRTPVPSFLDKVLSF